MQDMPWASWACCTCCRDIYVYVGSALGPGGLRHAWDGMPPREAVALACRLSASRNADSKKCGTRRARAAGNAAGRRPYAGAGASVPLDGFGASDCGCRSHLCFFTMPPSLAGVSAQSMCRAMINRADD